MGAHGLRGELRVRFFGDGPENLALQEEVWLGEDRDDPNARRYRVLGAGSGRGGEVRLRLEGVADRTAAESLRGRLVLARPAALAPLGEGEFYWHELVGCRVESEAGEPVGEVTEIWEGGRHDVLVVRTDDGRRVLVPTAREIMKQVDAAARRIVIDAIPGLIDADD